MGFAQRLVEAVRRVGNPVLVGIDPRLGLLPRGFAQRFPGGPAEAIGAFACEVVDIVSGRVPAVKFQAAFFECLGPRGMTALRNVAAHARRAGLIVIFDGKRNDIGTTAQAYAEAYLARAPGEPADADAWDADALTINPYLGSDGIVPFADVAAARGNGLFVLVRTSNPSAREFQDLVSDGRPVYRHVAERLAAWARPLVDESGYSAVGAVVGATYPEELAELRAALPGVVFLVPGYGAQGGSARDVAAAFDEHGLGAIVNNSRGLTFAYRRPELKEHDGPTWQRAVEIALDEMISDLSAHTPAGRLARA